MKWLLFDVGNVIIKAELSISYGILSGYGVPKENVESLFMNKDRQPARGPDAPREPGPRYLNDDYKDFCRGAITAMEFYIRLVRDHFKFNLSYEQVVHAHNQCLHTIDRGVIGIIERLSESPGFGLAFATDTNEWQTAREAELGLDLSCYSDKIFRSHEVHMLKSDDGFFDYILKKLGAVPSEVTLIDDSPGKVQKAKGCGLDVIRFKNARQLSLQLSSKGYLS